MEKGLVELLKRKELHGLVKELESGKTTLNDCLRRTEGQWKEFYQLEGIDIFNYLHPDTNRLGTYNRKNIGNLLIRRLAVNIFSPVGKYQILILSAPVTA